MCGLKYSDIDLPLSRELESYRSCFGQHFSSLRAQKREIRVSFLVSTVNSVKHPIIGVSNGIYWYLMVSNFHSYIHS